MADVEMFLSACDEKRQANVVHTALRRLTTALRRRLIQPDPLDLKNGGLFLYWRSGVSASTSGYKRPAICLGFYRSLVVGVQGGHLITAHLTRCLLHARSTHNPADRDSAEMDLPQNRDRTLETPFTPADIGDPIGQFLPKIHDQNAHVEFSPHDTTVDPAELYLGSHVENDTQAADQTSDHAQKSASSLNPDMESTELNRNAHNEAKPMHSHLPHPSGSVRAQAGLEPPADEPPIETAADELRNCECGK
jgi:hypothetical protein